MQVEILTLGFDPSLGAFDDSALQEFLRHRVVLGFREHFFEREGRPYLLCVIIFRFAASQSSIQSPKRPASRTRCNPSSTLTEAQMSVFEHIRLWRSEQARKDGVPPYVVLTNQELEAIIQKQPTSLTALTQIEGLGKKKVDRYGKALLDRLGTAPNGTPQ